MTVLRIRERSDYKEGSEYKRAIAMMKEGLSAVKEGLEKVCDLSEEMEDRYSDEDGYSERSHYRYGERGYDERRGYRR